MRLLKWHWLWMCRCNNTYHDCVVHYYRSSLSYAYYSGSPAFLTGTHVGNTPPPPCMAVHDGHAGQWPLTSTSDGARACSTFCSVGQQPPSQSRHVPSLGSGSTQYWQFMHLKWPSRTATRGQRGLPSVPPGLCSQWSLSMHGRPRRPRRTAAPHQR
ncbi:hypothetical protein BKA93DRAFT_556247 [Sparassis latifolia]